MLWFEPPEQLVDWVYCIPKVLSDEDILFIEDYAKNNQSKFKKAELRTNSDTPYDDSYRRTKLMFLDDMDYFKNLYKKIIEATMYSNNVHFKYNISYTEVIQYGLYHSSEKGFYDIHCDSYLRNTSGFIRKISSSIMLSDSSEFTGGKFLLHTGSKPIECPMDKGDMILFPSFLPHSVTPVETGERKTLVSWTCGPNFV